MSKQLEVKYRCTQTRYNGHIALTGERSFGQSFESWFCEFYEFGQGEGWTSSPQVRFGSDGKEQTLDLRIELAMILLCREKNKYNSMLLLLLRNTLTGTPNTPQLEWMGSLVTVIDNQDQHFHETNPKFPKFYYSCSSSSRPNPAPTQHSPKRLSKVLLMFSLSINYIMLKSDGIFQLEKGSYNVSPPQSSLRRE